MSHELYKCALALQIPLRNNAELEVLTSGNENQLNEQKMNGQLISYFYMSEDALVKVHGTRSIHNSI